MTPERQVLVTLLAAQRILFEGVLQQERPNLDGVCKELMFVLDNTELAPVLSGYLQQNALSLDGPEVAQLVERARQPSDSTGLRIVGGTDVTKEE